MNIGELARACDDAGLPTIGCIDAELTGWRQGVLVRAALSSRRVARFVHEHDLRVVPCGRHHVIIELRTRRHAGPSDRRAVDPAGGLEPAIYDEEPTVRPDAWAGW
jgi:hypothetical protein